MSGREDVEAIVLADLIADARDEYPRIATDMDSGELADRILASSWLAAHVEAVRVSERVRLAGDSLLRIDALVEKHRWNGGYFCGCGAEMNSPQTWNRHVLEDALDVGA